jgi:protein arginine kinase
MMFTDGAWREMPDWLSGRGPSSDVVVCTRARLARNLAGEWFPHRLDESGLNRVRIQLTGHLLAAEPFGGGWGLDLTILEANERLALREAFLASRDLLREPEGRALVVARDRSCAAMVNEEDHLRLQCYRAGFDPLTTCLDVLAIDRLVEADLEIAFSEEVGYLTACPTNVGTGLRLSALVHLPGLVLGGEIEKVLNSLRQLQFAVRGFEGEGSAVRGALFQVSNLASLGRGEEDLAGDFARHVAKVVHYERMAIERLYQRDPHALEDLAHRALAILQHARVMTGQEVLDRLSHVRVGVMLDILPRIDAGLLNRALVMTQTAHLQLAAERTLPPLERGRLRADLLRDLLREV